jgi:uncharacterized protein YgiB involved in biofilm formation
MNDSVDFSSVGSAAIPAAAFAVPILTGFLAGAMIMDGGRYLKLQYILYKKEQRKLNKIKAILLSLDRVPTNQLISLLKAA